MAAIEKLIGGRWYAVLGAVIVVIGVGLFFRLALQQGWLVLTPAARCIAGAVFGAVLLVAGEIARRRVGDNAAAGLSAAGVGVAYASVYAAYGLYDRLLPQVPAFMILAGVAALGIFIGARARQVSVAIVSLLCGYLTPILLSEAQPRPFVLPAYLFTLLIVGLGLSAWRGGRFVALRSLVWWATLILGAIWSLRYGGQEPLTALGFLALSWAAIHAELAVSSGRFGLVAGGNVPDEEELGDAEPPRPPRRPGLMAWRPLSSSFSTTAWAALLGTLILRGWLQPDWLAAAGLAVASGMLSMVLSGHLRVLRDRPQTDSQRLGACLVMQCGALIIAASALAVQGPAQAVFWLAMGVAVVLGGRWIGSRGLDVYGLVVVTLATGRAIFWESWNGSLTGTGVEFVGLYLNLWGVLMASIAGGWLVIAFLLRRSAEPRSGWLVVSNLAVAVGMTLLWGSLLHDRASTIPLLVGAITLGLALTPVGLALRSDGLRAYSLMVLVGASAAPVVYRCWTAGAAGEGVDLLGLRLTAWSAALSYLTVAWLAAARLGIGSAGSTWRALLTVAAGAGVASALGAVSHEHASGSSLLVAWIVIAVATGAARFVEPRLALERWGVAVLGVSIVAWINIYPFWGEGWRASTQPAGLHPGLWTGVALAGTMALFARRLVAPKGPGEPVADVLVGLCFAAMTAMVFASTSLEVGRSAALLAHDRMVQRAAVSVWWGVFAFALIALGFALRGRSRVDPARPRGVPVCRQVGLALLGVAALKALVFDLGEVNPLGRVISIVGVGLLMLAVSVTYAKVSARLAPARADEAPAAP